MENVEVHDSLTEHDIAYYKLTVLEDDTIEKIIFHVSAISGDIDVYMKKNELDTTPNFNNSDRMGYSEIESLMYTKSTVDGALSGNYYMSVTGWSAAYYNILVKIYRK